MSRVGIAHLCRGREWRGGERQVRLLITTLDGRPEFDQHLFTGRSSVLAKSLAGAHGSLVEIPWRAAWDPRAFGLALLGLRRLLAAHPCDLVLHAHDSHALAVGVAASRLLRIPLIATRRSNTVPGRLWRCPDRVVALSGSVEQSLLDGGVALARIVRIPSAVSLDELSRMPGRALDARASDRTPVLIAVGALTPEKDHATLLRALAALRVRLPSARLVLVGEGPQRDPLAALARRLSLGDAVRFEGARADAAALIRDASVLVQPSRREALGTAVLEAMALGTPVVASAVGGLAELLGDGAGLLVPPGDAVAFAEAVARLLTDPPLAGGLTREARARIERYDAPEVAGRVAQVYRSVLQTTR